MNPRTRSALAGYLFWCIFGFAIGLGIYISYAYPNFVTWFLDVGIYFIIIGIIIILIIGFGIARVAQYIWQLFKG